MSPLSRRRFAISPRLVVLWVLLASFAWALVFPLRLTRPPSAPLTTVYVAGLALIGAALALVLRAAVSPEQSTRSRVRLVGLVAVACLALWWPAFAWAEAGQEPWAWVAGFAIGASALADLRAASGAAALLTAAAAAGAAIFDGSVTANLTITLVGATAMWLLGVVFVWLLGLLWAAEAGRDAEAGLVLAQERLRASRELHDVLGHRLGIIAVKAELAAELAGSDPVRSAAESQQIRALAAATLAEARRAVHGETVTDLATQLASAELVLRSAGIGTTIDVDAGQVPTSASQLLAAVVREAVTNILRHSEASTVSIALEDTALVIVNDGATTGMAPSGTGLASLAARCAESGARLVAGATSDGGFELRVELAPSAAGAR